MKQQKADGDVIKASSDAAIFCPSIRVYAHDGFVGNSETLPKLAVGKYSSTNSMTS
ncbi:MAG: hypothetical protein ACI83P_002684 [Janthinobacterium sp.]|jgi:hypothetical protein